MVLQTFLKSVVRSALKGLTSEMALGLPKTEMHIWPAAAGKNQNLEGWFSSNSYNRTLIAHINLTQVTSRAEENGHILSPATILASLLHSQEELEVAQARLKMSGLERDTATFIIEKRNIGEVDLKTVKCWWVDTKTKSPQNNKAILQEFIKYIGR